MTERLPFSKVAVKARLIAIDKWQEFLKVREGFKRQGLQPNQAWAKALESFPEGLEGGPAPPPQGLAPIPAAPPGQSRPSGGDTEPVPSDTFKGKTCTRAQAVDWVADHLAVSDVEAEDAPSAFAWALFTWARRSPMNENSFWEKLFVRLLPSRSEVDSQARFHDDGSEVLGAIERLQGKE
jgi:hypothetical protein